MANSIATSDPTAAQALFQADWQIYRRIVAQNLLFHHEAYAGLAEVLRTRARQPFRFLDIACGDASASLVALRGQNVAGYCGIDLSRMALDLAAAALAGLDCPVKLIEGDFVAALKGRTGQRPTGQADVAWIGLSLHHLLPPAKAEAIRAVRALLPPGGLFMIYEFVLDPGESREAWLARWDGLRRNWVGFAPDESAAIARHFATADHPETGATWGRLGREAGFVACETVYASPGDVLRLYAFH